MMFDRVYQLLVYRHGDPLREQLKGALCFNLRHSTLIYSYKLQCSPI